MEGIDRGAICRRARIEHRPSTAAGEGAGPRDADNHSSKSAAERVGLTFRTRPKQKVRGTLLSDIAGLTGGIKGRIRGIGGVLACPSVAPAAMNLQRTGHNHPRCDSGGMRPV